ncbi:MAG: HAMP domain-containing histidine kinase [FCB group bacterium]|nr:HAMP domain-containing histidine kinase [FCB group bacterium]
MLTDSKKIILGVLFTVILIALINFAWWLYYLRTEKLMDNQLSRRLVSVAKTGAIALKSSPLEKLTANDLSAYAQIVATLEKIRRADSLAEVFIVDQNYRILVTTSLETDSIYFLAALNGRYIDSIFYSINDLAIATPSYKTGSVFLKSAFAPLLDSTGLVIAVLGVEANVDYFDALTALKKNLYYSIFISLVGGIIIGFIFLLFQKKITSTEQKLFLNQTHSFLGRMVAVVSHEIKNPLMIIRASAERLLKKNKSEESQFIVEEIDRLNQIVTGYLHFASTKGKFVEHDQQKSINMAEFIQNIKKHFQSNYPHHQINWLEAEIDSHLTINTYPRSLRQVILNLLINGADACLADERPITVGINVKNNKDRIKITIIDHGSGLNKKEIKKIFSPFYTTKTTGSGLGLYLSKKIIEDMGGILDINSIKGKQTELIIDLPITE